MDGIWEAKGCSVGPFEKSQRMQGCGHKQLAVSVICSKGEGETQVQGGARLWVGARRKAGIYVSNCREPRQVIE